MPNLNITKNYQDLDILTEQDLDDALDSIETFLNTTKIDSTNIQVGGVSSDNIAATSITTAKIATAAVTTAKIDDLAVTRGKLETAVQNSLVPAGVMHMYGGTSAPSGYLLCDGSVVSRATYADLFAAIGTAFGEGDGSTTFHLPDPRGEFIRGTSSGTGRDPDAGSRTASNTGGNTGDNVGSKQGTQLLSHNHTTLTGVIGFDSGGNGASVNGAGPGTTTSSTSGGSESRPRNLNMNFIIKT